MTENQGSSSDASMVNNKRTVWMQIITSRFIVWHGHGNYVYVGLIIEEGSQA